MKNTIYIQDTETGHIRPYGKNCHDSLKIIDGGRFLEYYNLQCGEGSLCRTFVFCDENGNPDPGNDYYANIGGFEEYGQWIEDEEGDIICRDCKAYAPKLAFVPMSKLIERQHRSKYCPECGRRMVSE